MKETEIHVTIFHVSDAQMFYYESEEIVWIYVLKLPTNPATIQVRFLF